MFVIDRPALPATRTVQPHRLAEGEQCHPAEYLRAPGCPPSPLDRQFDDLEVGVSDQLGLDRAILYHRIEAIEVHLAREPGEGRGDILGTQRIATTAAAVEVGDLGGQQGEDFEGHRRPAQA